MEEIKKASIVRRTMVCTAAVVVAEPLAASILLPFVVFMVRSFQQVEEGAVGLWCGIITSSFFVPQMLTAPLYGMLSDRLGRKPVLIFGLLGAAVFMIGFGLSRNLGTAIVCRALCGLFNGNAGVSRTSIGELAHNHGLDKGRAFGIFGFCTALGTLMGPLIGGYLSMPAEKYGISGSHRVFETYPFLLPCLVSAIYNLIAAGISIFVLPETNIHRGTKAEIPICCDSEREPLLSASDQSQAGKAPQQRSSGLFHLLAGQGIIALHAIVFDEMYPVIAATAAPIGLAFSSNQIARSLLVLGPVVLLVQLLCYPWLARRLSYVVLWRTSAFAFLAAYSALPFLPWLPNGSTLQWICLCITLACRVAAVVIGYTSIAILLIEMSPPNKRGVIIGFAQTAISAARAIGPTIGGAVWSWGLSNGRIAPFNQDLLYLLLLSLAFLQIATSFGLKAI